MRAWVLVAAAGTVAGVLAHRHCARPWLTRWGATDDEIARDLPGDELVDARGPRTTRAITIDAPPETVWAWLAQIGEDRAGFYSYSWLERLAGCRMHNAWSVHEEWQHREAGETVWLAQRYGELGRQVVARLDPERVLAMTSPADYDAIVAGRRAAGAWTFVVEPSSGGRTRLLARGSGGAVGTPLFDIAHFVMEQKMMRGIKDRAERGQRAHGSRSTDVDDPAESVVAQEVRHVGGDGGELVGEEDQPEHREDRGRHQSDRP